MEYIRERAKRPPHLQTFDYSDFFPSGIAGVNLIFRDPTGEIIDIYGTSRKFYGEDIKTFIDSSLQNFVKESYNIRVNSSEHVNLTVIHYVSMQSSEDEIYFISPIGQIWQDDNFPTKVAEKFSCEVNSQCSNYVRPPVSVRNVGAFYGKFEKSSGEEPVEAICFVMVVTQESPLKYRSKFGEGYAARLNNCLGYFASKLSQNRDLINGKK